MMTKTRHDEIMLEQAKLFAGVESYEEFSLLCVMHGMHTPRWRNCFWWLFLKKKHAGTSASMLAGFVVNFWPAMPFIGMALAALAAFMLKLADISCWATVGKCIMLLFSSVTIAVVLAECMACTAETWLVRAETDEIMRSMHKL